MTVANLAKEALVALNKKHVAMTPENYMREFCRAASTHNIVLADCNIIDKYRDKLNPNMQVEISKYNVDTVDELLTFLVVTLNKVSQTNDNQQYFVLTTLIKRLLQSIAILPSKNAKKLAENSLEKIEYLTDINGYKELKDIWFDFLSDYDDAYYRKLSAFCDIKSNNIEDMIDEIVACLHNREDGATLESISSVLIASLTPSFASSIDDELATLSYELKNSPSILTSAKVQEEVKSLVKRRIKLDKDEINNKVATLDKVLEHVSENILSLMNKSNLSKSQIQIVKNDLESLDKSKHTFDTFQNRLIKIASSLEIETDNLVISMQKDSTVVKSLQDRIEKLELALSEAKKESKKDFLTGLLNKRALDENLHRVEKGFDRYTIDYSVCFFDIDHFKVLNDTFGHEAGDIVLKRIGRIFNQYKRDVDIIGRYGGEEFLAILPNTEIEGALIFAQKIRMKVEEYNFIYKDERISVTISAGVSNRKDFANQTDLINGADEMLYNSKENGRNRVYPDDIIEL